MKAKIKRFFLLLATVVMFALCGILTACGEPDAVDQTSIKYDGSMITWTEVDKADGYIVSINGGKEYSASTNQFSYPAASTEDRIEITVTAVRKDKESESATKLFTRLPKIEETSIFFDENGKMTWSQVAGASEYILEINGKESRTAALEYSAFPQGQTNAIRIKPVAVDDSSFSEWSVQLIKDYLAAPTNIKYDGQYITWTGNTYAQAYQVYIDGAKNGDPVTAASFLFDAQNSSFDVQVQSVGNGTRSFNSEIGEKTRFVFLKDITGFNVQDGVLTWDEVEEASSYLVKVNGVEHEVETNSYDNLPANKDNRIQVKPLTEEGTTYFANWSAEQTVRVLVAPDLKWDDTLVLDGAKMNVLSWDKIDGEVGGYNIKIESPDGSVKEETLSADAVQYGNEAFELTGVYKISIQTIPVANSNSYKSVYSKPVSVERLPAPNAAQRFITSDASNVKNGLTINWNAVSGASGYQLYKDGEKISGTITTATTNVPYNVFMADDETEAKVINFSIQTLGNVKTFQTERKVTLSSLTSYSLKAQVQVLAQPQNLTIEGYTASWTAVDKANGYSVTCNDQMSTDTTTYDLTNLQSGTYNFGVCAKGNGGDVLASNYTPTKQLVRLAAPYDIELDPTSNGDRLVWETATDKADHYDVYWTDAQSVAVDASSLTDIGKEITTTSRALFMRAAANYWNGEKSVYYITSLPSQTVTFTKLDTPTFNATIVNTDGTKLVWNAPENAQNTTIKYRLYDAAGVAQNTTPEGCEYDISTLAAGSYTFSVRAIGYGKFVSSDKSAPVSFEKLATPSVTTDTTAYKWKVVGGEVKQYVVIIDGKIVDEIKPVSGQVEYSYEPKFVDFKSNGYAVQIYAQGDGINSVNSVAWTKTQKVKAADYPEFTLTYHNQKGEQVWQAAKNGYLLVTITDESDYTNGYTVEIGGTTKEIAKGETTLTYKPDESGKYEARVYANGGEFNENGTYYYVKSSTDSAKSLTILTTPTNIEVLASSIKWTAVSGTSTYGYVITLSGGTIVEGTTTTGSTLNLVDLKIYDVSTIEKVEIYAKGNQTTTVGSEWAEWNRS